MDGNAPASTASARMAESGSWARVRTREAPQRALARAREMESTRWVSRVAVISLARIMT
ncbi:hypothetical protein BC829DRAFT_401446 [Chytridium lagenaria]|nr:hypothetical protein BC829DRAFT_401446 [Chytridium lagenaria]